MTWFTSIFSGKAESGDLISGRTMNITKVTGLLVPIGTAIAAVFESQTGADGPLAGLTPGQKLILWVSVLAFLLVIVVTDMAVRGVATAASLRTSASPLPAGMNAHYTEPEPDVPCLLVAIRALNGNANSKDGEFLIVYEERRPQGKMGQDAVHKPTEISVGRRGTAKRMLVCRIESAARSSVGCPSATTNETLTRDKVPPRLGRHAS